MAGQDGVEGTGSERRGKTGPFSHSIVFTLDYEIFSRSSSKSTGFRRPFQQEHRMLSLRKTWLAAVMGVLALLCATGPAQAQPSLWLGSTDGGNSGIVVGVGGVAIFTGALPGSAN